MRYDDYDPPVLFVREPETVGAYDAKTRLPELLADVEAGASYIITRHGRPIARLLPVRPVAAAEGVIDALFTARRGNRLEIPLGEAIAAGRR